MQLEKVMASESFDVGSTFCPSFEQPNAAVEAFILLAQGKFLFSPHMALQLLWSRTINTQGRPGKNIPAELHMKHLNRECKNCLSGLGLMSQMLQ